VAGRSAPLAVWCERAGCGGVATFASSRRLVCVAGGQAATYPGLLGPGIPLGPFTQARPTMRACRSSTSASRRPATSSQRASAAAASPCSAASRCAAARSSTSAAESTCMWRAGTFGGRLRLETDSQQPEGGVHGREHGAAHEGGAGKQRARGPRKSCVVSLPPVQAQLLLPQPLPQAKRVLRPTAASSSASAASSASSNSKQRTRPASAAQSSARQPPRARALRRPPRLPRLNSSLPLSSPCCGRRMQRRSGRAPASAPSSTPAGRGGRRC
jgi:hypothetical protein